MCYSFSFHVTSEFLGTGAGKHEIDNSPFPYINERNY